MSDPTEPTLEELLAILRAQHCFIRGDSEKVPLGVFRQVLGLIVEMKNAHAAELANLREELRDAIWDIQEEQRRQNNHG